MTKLAKKFLVSISAVLLLVIGLSVMLNNTLIGRYDTYLKKKQMDEIAGRLLDSGFPNKEWVEQLERENQVIIVMVRQNEDINQLNEELRQAFLNKGLGIARYWLWDRDYEKAMEKGRWLRLYGQDKVNYDLAVLYVNYDGYLIGIASVIPNMADTISLINQSTILIFSGALILIIFICIFLVKKITDPLKQMADFAEEIAAQNYGSVFIHTHDELETVAESMNQMSESIQKNQEVLKEKNRQMEELLNNVSHELKTPIALIKVYAAGIKDGMDDGTFMDTIIRQNNRMGEMTEKLLMLSRLGKKEARYTQVDLANVLNDILLEQKVNIQKRKMEIHVTAVQQADITSDPELTRIIMENLITNGVKYASGNDIWINLGIVDGRYVFQIENETDMEGLEQEQLWEPFYVGEPSRNEEMSGTGLGLALVKAGAKACGFLYGCSLKEGNICFWIKF